MRNLVQAGVLVFMENSHNTHGVSICHVFTITRKECMDSRLSSLLEANSNFWLMTPDIWLLKATIVLPMHMVTQITFSYHLNILKSLGKRPNQTVSTMPLLIFSHRFNGCKSTWNQIMTRKVRRSFQASLVGIRIPKLTLRTSWIWCHLNSRRYSDLRKIKKERTDEISPLIVIMLILDLNQEMADKWIKKVCIKVVLISANLTFGQTSRVIKFRMILSTNNWNKKKRNAKSFKISLMNFKNKKNNNVMILKIKLKCSKTRESRNVMSSWDNFWTSKWRKNRSARILEVRFSLLMIKENKNAKICINKSKRFKMIKNNNAIFLDNRSKLLLTNRVKNLRDFKEKFWKFNNSRILSVKIWETKLTLLKTKEIWFVRTLRDKFGYLKKKENKSRKTLKSKSNFFKTKRKKSVMILETKLSPLKIQEKWSVRTSKDKSRSFKKKSNNKPLNWIRKFKIWITKRKKNKNSSKVKLKLS